jgi:hypothetical protein
MGRFFRYANHSREASRFSRNRPAVLWGVRSEVFAYRAEISSTPKPTKHNTNYHCNFGFAKGWRGAISRAIMRRNLDAGPVDSLSRLKRAAEERYTALQDFNS